MWSYSSPTSQKVANLFIGLSFILIFIGIFFGIRSIIKKESRWVGYIMILLSFLILLLELSLEPYGFLGFLYNIGLFHSMLSSPS